MSGDDFKAVTAAFVGRLRDQMGTAGCNDLFPSEFPGPICKRYLSDFELLRAWEIELHDR